MQPGSTRRRMNQSLATELPCQARFQALAESRRHIKRTAIADQADNIASPVQNGSAVFARLEMFVHSLAERRLRVVVDIVRQFPPNLNATDLYGGHVTRVSLSSNSRLRCSMPVESGRQCIAYLQSYPKQSGPTDGLWCPEGIARRLGYCSANGLPFKLYSVALPK